MVVRAQFRDWSREDYLARFEDKEQGPRIRKAIESSLDGRNGGEALRIARYTPKKEWQGPSLAALAKDEKKSDVEIVVEIEKNGGAGLGNVGMHAGDVRLL